MHPTAMSNGKRFFDTYVAKMTAPTVVEIGSQNVNGSLREVCPAGVRYVGLDFVEGDGVDVVLADPYRIPLDAETIDAIVCSSCFEHSEMFWLVFLEALRILKPGGVFYLNVPSNGAFHRYPVDCWRFYPDSGHAMVTWARRNGFQPLLLESYTARQYQDIWNDFVAVFLKDEGHLAEHPNRILATHDAFENGWMHGCEGFLRENSFPEDIQRIQALGNEVSERNGETQEYRQRLGDRERQAANLIRSFVDRDSTRLRSCLESEWYLQRNPDLIERHVDPYEHWLTYGASEGRLPCEDLPGLARDLIQERAQANSDRHAAELQSALTQQLERAEAASEERLAAIAKEYAGREQALQEVIAGGQQERLKQIKAEISDLVREQDGRTAARFDAVATELLQQRELLHTEIGALESRIADRQQGELHSMQQEITDLLQTQALRAAERDQAGVTAMARLQEESSARFHALERQMAADNQDLLAAFHSRLDQTEHRLREERDLLQTQYSQSLQALQNDLSALESSMSWRLSAPIRAIAALFGSRGNLPRVAGVLPASARAATPPAGPEWDQPSD